MADSDRHNPEAQTLLRRVRNRIEFILFASLVGFLQRIPRPAALWLGSAVGAVFYHLLRHDRAVALANLRIVLGNDAEPRELRRIARFTFRNVGRSTFNLFNLGGMTKDQVAGLVENPDDCKRVMSDLAARGRGVVFVTAHYGDWEFLVQAVAAIGYPTMIITEPLVNPLSQRLLAGLRSSTGNTIVEPKYALLKLLRGLKRGERVGTICDANGRRGRGGVWVDFFGLKVFNGVAMAELALRTNSVVVFAVGHPRPGGRIRLELLETIEPAPSTDHEADIQRLTQTVIDQHAMLVRRDPQWWMWTYKRWKRKPAPDAEGYPFYARYARVK